jgi:hypothetical protein
VTARKPTSAKATPPKSALDTDMGAGASPSSEAAVCPTDARKLERGRLVSYVADDAGHERTLAGIVTDVFEADGVFCARVAHLPDPLVLQLTALTLI